jgi:two-component system chemotaxis response regulator CheB
LRELLEAEGDIVVVGAAADGHQALAMAASLAPDLVTMDLEMPGVDGLETIERIMAECPVPILVVTGEPVGPCSDLGFRAVQCGALDILPKPSISNNVEGEDLRGRVRALATVPVFRHVHAPDEPPSEPAFRGSRHGRPAAQLVAIAAGSGGSRAVATVLRRLPSNLPCAIAIAQHVPPGFADGYASFLRSQTRLRVEIATRLPARCRPGTVFVAPDSAHLVCTRDGILAIVDDSLLQRYCPSATKLFESASEVYGDTAVGIILSGLGSDGIAGAAAMREVGALTIAEDALARPGEMPRIAVAAGVIERAMPIQLIADMVIAAACIPQERQTTPPPPMS